MYVVENPDGDNRDFKVSENSLAFFRASGTIFDEDSFWDKWQSDLASARKSIVIVSPYVLPDSVKQNLEILECAFERSVKVVAHVRGDSIRGDRNREALNLLKRSRISVKLSQKKNSSEACTHR